MTLTIHMTDIVPTDNEVVSLMTAIFLRYFIASVLLERLSVSTGGVLTDGDGGRVTVRPVRTGKGIMLNVESYALEAASELCDFYSEVIKRNAY